MMKLVYIHWLMYSNKHVFFCLIFLFQCDTESDTGDKVCVVYQYSCQEFPCLVMFV